MFNPFRINYDKPGRGVKENEPEKKGIFRYFEIIGQKTKELIILNLIFIITCIPVVTIGPSLAALTAVFKDYLDGNHSLEVSDYFSAFKKHFKRGFFVGIVALLFGFGFFYNLIYFMFFSQTLLGSYLAWLFVALVTLYIIVHNYVYTLLVSTNESVLELYTDAFILALAKLPLNIAVSACILIYPVLIGWFYFTPVIPMFVSAPITSTLVLCSMFAFCQLGSVMYANSIIKKL